MTQPDLKTTIRLEAAPDGLHIIVEYTGNLASIPAAVERLKAAGILNLVQACKPTPTNGKPKAETVEPLYKPDGTPCCPVHKGALAESQYDGWYCRAKAKPGDVQNAKGYCALRFTE